MDEKSAKSLEKEINGSDDVVMFYMEDAEDVKDIQPPTKLKNNPVFKPFEMFVKMYGLQRYTEINPTGILAVTYTVLWYNVRDVGQSLVLAMTRLYSLQSQEMGLGRYCRNGRNIRCDIRIYIRKFLRK